MEVEQKDKLNLKQFISIASQLAFNACSIIKQASQNKSLKKYEKGFNDPVTQADYHVQTMIIKGLNKFFPQLRLIGQETVDYKGQISIDYEKLSLDFCPQNVNFKDIAIPYKQVCVWIDPIDCTKGFIGGKMHYVTVLIGLSRNKLAYAGVIGKPYKLVDTTPEYNPCISIGVAQTKQAFVYSEKDNWTPLVHSPIHNPLLISTSRNRVNNIFQNLTAHLNGKNVFAGGSGNKITMVINGETDLLAYIASYTSKWDSCAGEAIVKAMGGYFFTQKKQTLQYDPDSKNYENSDGQICTMSKEVLDQVFQFFENRKNAKM